MFISQDHHLSDIPLEIGIDFIPEGIFILRLSDQRNVFNFRIIKMKE